MRLILHIGTEKTGSTDLQRFLYMNRAVLRDYSVGLSDVLLKPNNRKLATFCLAPDAIDDFLKDLNIRSTTARREYFENFEEEFATEVAALERWADTMVISSEHLHSRLRDPDALERLRKLLDKLFEEVRVVCYFREQSELARSLYSTYIRVGNAGDFEDFVALVSPDDHYYNYHAFFSKWADAFGAASLVPRLYGDRTMEEWDIRRDFLRFVKPEIVPAGFEYLGERENMGFGVTGIELGRIANRVSPRYRADGSVNALRRSAVEVIGRSTLGGHGSLAFESSRQIYDAFVPSNLEFALAFLGSDTNPFAPPTPQPSTVPDTVTVADVYRFFEDLISAVQRLPLARPGDASALLDLARKIETTGRVDGADAELLLHIASALDPEAVAARVLDERL